MIYTPSADGYVHISIDEGEAPFLNCKVTNKSGTALVQADISTLKATITNITTPGTVLNESTLTISTYWFDTIQTLTDPGGDVQSYNFGWQTLATYFKTTGFNESSQFKVEVWGTPVSGQPFKVCWWLITAQKSIVPIAS